MIRKAHHIALTKTEAGYVIDAWRAFGRFGAVADSLSDRSAYWPYGISVRVLIGSGCNPEVNDALWESQYEKAKFLLMRFGIYTDSTYDGINKGGVKSEDNGRLAIEFRPRRTKR